MYDDVPIVPNLYEAPSNPQARDCYYNITLDKYYIYDGTQWLEAKVENDSSAAQDTFTFKYSTDGGETFTTQTCDSFDSLCSFLNNNTSVLNTATDVVILSDVCPAVIVPRTSDTDLEGVALLKLNTMTSGTKDVFTLKYSTDQGNTFTTETYDDFYKLTDKTHSFSNQVTDIEVSMEEVTDPKIIKIGNEDVLTWKDIFILRYSVDGGETFVTENYDNYDALIDRINTSDMTEVTDIDFSMEKEPVWAKENPIVGKIYPKIIFNQKLVENLVMNTNEVGNNIFDGVLTFYKEIPKTSKYKVSFKNPGDTEWTTYEFNDVNEAIEVTNRWSENAIPTSAQEVKLEEIE